MRSVSAMALMAIVATAPVAAATVKDGVDAWQRSDYATAIGIWRPLADGGDADAAFNLAQAYKLGRGVPTDLKQAKLYYGKAAQAGHPQAAANYGLLLFQDGDRQNAMPWIKKASDAGDPRAQYVYGTALFNGDLAPKDWPTAYGLMTRAAAAGLPQATTSLAQMDQYVSPADRQKGLALATRMASQPTPPTTRTIVPPAVAAVTSPVKTPALAPAKLAAIVPNPPSSLSESVTQASKASAASKSITTPASTPVKLATGGRWQVQLGAYGSDAGAHAAWSSLSAKSPALRALQPSYEKAGAMIRLRATGLADRTAADKACAAAKSSGAACFPVAP